MSRRREDYNNEVFDFRNDDNNGEEDYLSWLDEPSNTQEEAGGADRDDDNYSTSGRSTSRGKGRRTTRQETSRYDETGMPYGASSVRFDPKDPKIPKAKIGVHQGLCLQIGRYLSHEKFGPVIRSAGLKVNDLEKKSISDLEDILQRCRQTAKTTGPCGGWVHQLAGFGCRGIEVTANKSGKVNLTGFADKVNQDPEAQNLLDMIAIDYGMKLNLPLPAQVAICLGTIAAKTATENEAKARMQNHVAQLQQQMAQQKQQQPQIQPTAQPNIGSTPAAAPVTGIHQSTKPVFRDYD